MSQVQELQQRFGIQGVVQIESGKGGLPRIAVTSDLASAEIYLYGGHVTQFRPRGAEHVLFVSRTSNFEMGKPIRGGIPVIFPWFGPRANHPESPPHGFARLRQWNLESCDHRNDGSLRIVLDLKSDDATMRYWPHTFSARLIVVISETLDLTMEVHNKGADALEFEQALHSYLRVGDVRQIRLEGLENTEYIDKVDGMKTTVQPAEPIRFSGETDRVYLKTQSTCLVRDEVLGRTIKVEKENSDTTVVWNPWIDKARAMPDFGDAEWPQMVCIETANVGPCAVRLSDVRTHRMHARISIAS